MSHLFLFKKGIKESQMCLGVGLVRNQRIEIILIKPGLGMLFFFWMGGASVTEWC
jgi:hypothetical protein